MREKIIHDSATLGRAVYQEYGAIYNVTEGKT